MTRTHKQGRKLATSAWQSSVNVLALAARAAAKLDYTTNTLEELCENDPQFGGMLDNREFLGHLDTIEFCCVSCGCWKPQRENGTPDGSSWQCKECVKDGY